MPIMEGMGRRWKSKVRLQARPLLRSELRCTSDQHCLDRRTRAASRANLETGMGSAPCCSAEPPASRGFSPPSLRWPDPNHRCGTCWCVHRRTCPRSRIPGSESHPPSGAVIACVIAPASWFAGHRCLPPPPPLRTPNCAANAPRCTITMGRKPRPSCGGTAEGI
jgi:hypothetical protein